MVPLALRVCRSARCRKALESNGLRGLEPSELQKDPWPALSIGMPLWFMCFCVWTGKYWLVQQLKRPARVRLLHPSCPTSFVLWLSDAVRNSERCFPHCVPLLVDLHSWDAESRSAYHLLCHHLFCFCGVRSLIIILSWETFPRKNATEVHEVQVHLVWFCWIAPHCLRLSCVCVMGSRVSQQQLDSNSHLKCCQR